MRKAKKKMQKVFDKNFFENIQNILFDDSLEKKKNKILLNKFLKKNNFTKINKLADKYKYIECNRTGTSLNIKKTNNSITSSIISTSTTKSENFISFQQIQYSIKYSEINNKKTDDICKSNIQYENIQKNLSIITIQIK